MLMMSKRSAITLVGDYPENNVARAIAAGEAAQSILLMAGEGFTFSVTISSKHITCTGRGEIS